MRENVLIIILLKLYLYRQQHLKINRQKTCRHRSHKELWKCMFGHLPDFFFVDRTSNIGHHCGTGIVRSLFRASEVVVIYLWTKEERKYRAFSILLGGSGSRYTLTSKCYTKKLFNLSISCVWLFPRKRHFIEFICSTHCQFLRLVRVRWSNSSLHCPQFSQNRYLKQTSFIRKECLIFKVEKGI